MKIVGVAASTGGPRALIHLFQLLAPDLPAAFLVVQHLPPEFVSPFAERLAAMTGWPAHVAKDGEELSPGALLVAPGDTHLLVEGFGSPPERWLARLSLAPPVGGHRPSAEPLFASMATACGRLGIGVVLTGMGSDGAQGLLKLKAAGGLTLGEAEATCVVFGMPRAAWEKGALAELLPLPHLARAIEAAVRAP
ncbi:MAG: two-component system, chemotaxis family, protein-glutamate methylesterase/glutaminase [Bacillota bacterium]|nr:two-component system, chemotaxis family, protein-glutamate methylesterase/glutaminase [Bacillota bacterium]MDK2855176.1 two-component system, chemotaxis family, protein-glutamate methylesterase/glutaminase [Bacillota bacterium]MDK2925026.1 two-component system, chemotaxis family, protein-glutamate methylesterase/glutaminase [Bacillota bacterium]